MTMIPDLSKDVELERLREEVRVFDRKLRQRNEENEAARIELEKWRSGG